MNEQQLVNLIEHHNKKYWIDNQPEITDSEYDKLVESLRRINPDHTLVHKIGIATVSSDSKVYHKVPMLSLDKAYKLEDILSWAKRHAKTNDEYLLIQPKYDGMSGRLDENGVLASRGDGDVGENLTDKIPLMRFELFDKTRPVDGEIIIKESEFLTEWSERVVKNDGTPYKNSRNAVAGVMNQKDISQYKSLGVKLYFVDYRTRAVRLKVCELASKWTKVMEHFEKLQDEYPMDGLVIKFEDKRFYESLGRTQHHPNGAIAFKFENSSSKTVITNMFLSFGKGKLTPMAEITPTEINGVVITKATLHNIAHVIENDIQIGDSCIIERAGDVIPYISATFVGNERKKLQFEYCPCCNSLLVIDGVDVKCVNKDCYETNLQYLMMSVKKFGINNLGEPTLRKIVNKYNAKDLSDILTLDSDAILLLDGFAKASAVKLADEIGKARANTTHTKIISALCIEGFSDSIIKTVLDIYPVQKLIDGVSEYDLAKIKGFSNKRAKSLNTGLAENKELLNKLLDMCMIKVDDKPKSNRPKVCFTGTMPNPRSYYEKIAEEYGYEPVDAVTKDTSLLVVSDINRKSSKTSSANKYGIKIVSVNEFMVDKKEQSQGVFSF